MPKGLAVRSYGAEFLTWVGMATTLNGIATFYPTDDGTSSGNPLFVEIKAGFPGVKLDTVVPTDAPLVSIKAIASDRKSVDVNCVAGKVLLALGGTLQLAPDGTTVYLQLWGI